MAQLTQSSLQSHVGIKSNRYNDMIADFIKKSADIAAMDHSDFAQEAAQQNTENHRQRGHVTLSVEGNISAGKSTFLKGITDHCPDLQSLMHVSPSHFHPKLQCSSWIASGMIHHFCYVLSIFS